MLAFNPPLSTDVLVVGGGIGGLCAAISAARAGAKTMVAEKADTRRSGSGATGNDHFACYYPKAHGSDIRVILKELRQSLVGAYHDEKLSLRFLEESIHMVDRWAGMGHQHEALRRRLRIHGSRLSRPSAHLAQVRRSQSEAGAHQTGQKGRRGNRQPHARRRPHQDRRRNRGRARAGRCPKTCRPSPSSAPRRWCSPPARPTVCIRPRARRAGRSTRPSAPPARARRRRRAGASAQRW